MIILLWLSLALVPWLLGAGILIVIYGKSAAVVRMTDAWIMGGMCCIGVAEVLHLLGTFAHLSLGRLLFLWHGIIVVLGMAALALVIRTYHMHKERFRILPERGLSYALPGILMLICLL